MLEGCRHHPQYQRVTDSKATGKRLAVDAKGDLAWAGGNNGIADRTVGRVDRLDLASFK